MSWEVDGNILLNNRMLEFASQLSISQPLEFSEWEELIMRLPRGSSFLSGQIAAWSALLPELPGYSKRLRLDGSFEEGVFLILLNGLHDESSGTFDIEEIYQLLAEHSRTVTWEVDAEGNYTYVSPVSEIVIGYKPEEMVGKMHFYDLFPIENRERFQKEAEEFFVNKKEFRNFLNQIQKTDGQKIWVATNAIPFLDEKGNLLGYKGNDTDVTERVLAEEALIEQSRLLKLVTDNMFDMVVLKDLDARITYVAKAHHSLGYDPKDLIGHSCLELVHDDEVDFLREEINKLKQDAHYVLKAEYRIKCADGSFVWLESLGRVLVDDKAKPNGILFSSRDISERKSAQSELKISTLRFQHLFENMSQGVVYQSIDGKINAVNPAAELILGVTAEDMMGRTSYNPEWKAIKEDGTPFLGHEHPAMIALKTGKPVYDTIMGVMNPRDNAYRWIQVSAIPQYLPGENSPFQVFASFTDITKRVELEKSLKERESFLQDIIQNSGSLVYVKDTQGRYIVVNRRWESLLDLPEHEVIGKTDGQLFPEKVAMQCMSSDQLALKSKDAISVEETIINRKTGEESIFLTVKFLLKDNEGQVTGICGMSTDISALKYTENALLKSEAQLKSLLDGAEIAIWSVNRNFELTFANNVFLRDFEVWTGIALLMGNPFLQHLPEELKQEAISRFNRVFYGEVVRVIEEIPTSSGLVYLSTSIYPIVIKGEVEGAAVFSINITSEEQARKALAESESRFRSLFDDNASSMYIYNPYTDQFVDVNPATESLFGFPKKEFLKLKPSRFIGEQQVADENLNRLLNEKSVREERQMVKKSGVKIDVEVYSSLIPDGKDWLVYEIVHDITIRNRYFEAMEAQNKILKDIAWTQSHLVRAPLARILGLVDLLKEREYAEMSQDQIIQLICTSSEELDAVIRDVSEKAYLAGQFEPVDEALVQEETMIISVAPEVLLVDDDRIILTMHKGAVVKQGLTEAPYLFMNGETAYQHLLDNDAEMKVFIVFLDLNMPVMDGWQFLEKLEKVSWKSVIKVVVLTSSVDTADRIRAQQYRYVVSYQNKPVNASMISELRYHPELKSYWPQ